MCLRHADVDIRQILSYLDDVRDPKTYGVSRNNTLIRRRFRYVDYRTLPRERNVVCWLSRVDHETFVTLLYT